MKETIAILAITKNGIKIAKKIQNKLTDVKLYVPSKFKNLDKNSNNIIWYDDSTSKIISDLFKKNDALICIFSLGAVIRLISSSIRDKKTDPAVIVIDDQSNFVISTLSGHLGGANILTRKVSSILNSIPVITTAADVNNTISVDLVGSKFGWIVENSANVTRISALMVNDEKIAMYQDTGQLNWWDGKKFPSNVIKIEDLNLLKQNDSIKGSLVITDKVIKDEEILRKSVIYRPKSLVVGIGLHWDTTKDDIFNGIKSVFEIMNLSFNSIRNITSIKKKTAVKGLEEFSKDHNLELILFDSSQLDGIKVPNPSNLVRKFEGVSSVSEASSLLSSKGELIVPKQKFPPKLTIAVSRVNFL